MTKRRSRVLRRSLAARGYEVQVAGCGEEALEIFNAWAPDLVITDLSMPNMGGLELCRRIRATSQAPIIVLGQRRRAGKGRGARRWRRRLRHQAIRHRRTAGACAGHAAARACDGRPTGQGPADRRFPGRPGIAQRQGARREVHLTPKEYELLVYLIRHPNKVLTHRAPAGRGLGRRLCRTDRISARLHRPASQEDRSRPGQTSPHPDRAVDRLPLQSRWITSE